MTDKPQEIDDILNAVTNFTYDAMAHPGDPLVGTLPTMNKATAKQAILDWHNKQVEKMLDRLLNGTTTIYLDTEPNNPVKSNIEPLLFKAEIKAAIRAERNKLKEAEL